MNHIIQVDHLMKKYKRAEAASVDEISFYVKEGEFFAFLGPNGAGKSTTISILTTTLSMTSGTVTIAGYDLEREAKEIRSNIGVLFQNPSLDLELTAEENIRMHVCIYGLYGFKPMYRMMPREYRQQIEQLAEIVGLKNDLFKKLKTFSGGMRRKLEIMRGFMHNPRILFLDEPTQGLDPTSRRSIWEYIHKIRKENNITVFLTTHYLEEAEGADRICIMNHGRIVMTGTPDELKSRLINKIMYIDADDRGPLHQELKRMNADYTETDLGLAVKYYDLTPQPILSQLTTPLTKLNIYKPTLEEAYFNLIREEREEEWTK